MKKVLTVCIALASCTAMAEGGYHAELREGFSNGTIDYGDNSVQIKQQRISATYYFDEISFDKGPMGEAAFLAKSSSVSGLFGETRFEDHNEEVELDDTEFGLRLVAASGFIFDFGYIGSDDEENHHDFETIYIGAGSYIGKNHAVVFTYGNDVEKDSTDFEISNERYNLNYHGVIALQGDSAFAVDATLAYVNVDYDGLYDDDGYDARVGVTYYPIKRLGLEIAGGREDVGDTTTTSWSFTAEYFLIDQFAVNIAYLSSEEDIEDAIDTIDADQIAVGVKARF